MIFTKARHAMLCALAFATAGIGSVQAADLPLRKAAAIYTPPPPPSFSWTGLYAGLNIGGAVSTSNVYNTFAGAGAGSLSGVLGGIQAGYNYQLTPLFVVGIEDEVAATSLSRNAFNAAAVSLPWVGSGRARAGITVLDSHLFLYGTGGLAMAELKNAAIDKWRIGWTAGGGAEWAFMPNWSAKAEYLYSEFKRDGLPDWNKPRFHTFRVGVNYHFDLFR